MNAEYLKFLESVEEALYPFPHHFERNAFYDSPDPDNGLVYTDYKGSATKAYSQPIFQVKKDHVDEGKGCFRCRAGTDPFTHWLHDDDQVTAVRWYITFDDEGRRKAKDIHFIPFFAARKAHP